MTKQERMIREAIARGQAAGVKLRYGSFGLDFNTPKGEHNAPDGACCPIGMCLLGKPRTRNFEDLARELNVPYEWIDAFWEGFDHIYLPFGSNEAYALGWKLRDEYLPPPRGQ